MSEQRKKSGPWRTVAVILILMATFFMPMLAVAPAIVSNAPPTGPVPTAPALSSPSFILGNDALKALSGMPRAYVTAAIKAMTALPDAALRERMIETGFPGAVGVTPAQARAMFTLFVSGWDYAGAFAAGCVTGAAIGFIAGLAAAGVGSLVGAGAGCVVAGTVGVLLFYWGTQVGSAGLGQIEDTWAIDKASQIANLVNETEGNFQIAMSAMNLTQGALNSMMDHAAVAQIGNSTFNAIAALNDSGLAYTYQTMILNYVFQLGGVNALLGGVGQAGYGPNGLFSNTNSTDIFLTPQGGSSGVGQSTWFSAMGSDVQIFARNTGLGQPVWFSQNASFSYECGTGSTAVLNEQNTIAHPHQITLASTASNTRKHANIPAGMYDFLYSGGTGCLLDGLGILGMPTGAFGPGSQINLVNCGPLTTKGCFTYGNETPQAVVSGHPMEVFVDSCTPGCSVIYGPYLMGGTLNVWDVQMDTQIRAAENAAQVYFTFLRGLGFTSISQIPSNCVIPAPDNFLPPAQVNSLQNLSVNGTNALFLAWLNGLSVFYGAGPNSGNFCSGHAQFHIGSEIFNPFIVLTGYIYVQPVGRQAYANVHTWNVNSSMNLTQGSCNAFGSTCVPGGRGGPANFTLWPTTKTVIIPQNVKWAVPTNDPLEGYVPGSTDYSFLTLYGNGTPVVGGNSSGAFSNPTPGVSLYITGCTENGTPVSVCNLQLSTVTNVTIKISCGPTNCAGPIVPVANPCGFSLLSSLAGIFGFLGTATSCAVAEIIFAVIIVVLIVVVIYIALAVVRAGRRY